MKLSDLFEVDAEKLRKAMDQQTKAVRREKAWTKKLHKKREGERYPRLVPDEEKKGK